jgi:acetoacetyl-CoA synthetase
MQALWNPSPELIAQSNLTRFRNWLNQEKGLSFDSYDDLWTWSVTDLDNFWTCIWEYFGILHDGSITHVVQGSMPTCTWFEGTALNYAEHIFRKATSQHPAIIFKSESSPLQEISWASLRQQVASLQQHFKAQGIQAGDRIVAYMPACPEATVAFLAANALGAVWSSCSPDFGTNSVIDRFAQIEPKILVAVDSYNYGGKTFDKTSVISQLAEALPTLQEVIIVTSGVKPLAHSQTKVVFWHSVTANQQAALEFTRVPFAHPIWILYSSGTTGLPKAITHSHGGILLEQLKYGTFHNDFKPGERCFWYTTTGWMMWNYIHGSLLAGGTMVLYDGSPAYPDLNALWKFCQDARISHFGTSAGFILESIKKDIHPRAFDLSALRSIGSTGSTLPPEGFDWIYREVKDDLWLASMSGGTDVCSAFVGGNPTLPVYSGEIQCRALGCKLEAFDEAGTPVTDEVGEMVISQPMPSMPIYFWNDPGYKRYTESYFEMYPAIWRHGDWIRITPRGGIVIYGRSDATLNRGGIRIGTSEIYRAVDQVTEVKDSLIICIEKDKGEFWMPLFVLMQEGIALTDDIRKKINTTIRQAYSPRHVPDEIMAVPGIPYTISGKKTETPVKKVLMGQDAKKVVNAGALKNPESMEFFVALAGKAHS